MNFGGEGGSQSHLTKLVELVVDEPEQNATLSDTRVAYQDNLDLRQGLLHHFMIG